MVSSLNPSVVSFLKKTFFIALFYHKEKALPTWEGLLALRLTV
jgi:hypothetical protein